MREREEERLAKWTGLGRTQGVCMCVCVCLSVCDKWKNKHKKPFRILEQSIELKLSNTWFEISIIDIWTFDISWAQLMRTPLYVCMYVCTYVRVSARARIRVHVLPLFLLLWVCLSVLNLYCAHFYNRYCNLFCMYTHIFCLVFLFFLFFFVLKSIFHTLRIYICFLASSYMQCATFLMPHIHTHR